MKRLRAIRVRLLVAVSLGVVAWVVTPHESPRTASVYAGAVAADVGLLAVVHQPAAVARRVPRWLALIICAIGGAFLLVPVLAGWQFTTLTRQQVLDDARQLVGNSRVEAKFVHVDESTPEFRALESARGSDQWVVASTSPSLATCGAGYACTTPWTWSMRVFPDGSETSFEWVGPGSGSAWPPFFDGLRDRLAPAWWPLVLPVPLAFGLAALTLGAGIRILVPSWRPPALPIFRRLGRRSIGTASMLAAVGLVMLALTLLSPWILGWPPAGQRQSLLNTALLGDPRRAAISLVPVTEVPISLRSASGSPLDGNVWVVATSTPPPVHKVATVRYATWVVQVFLVETGTPVAGTAGFTGSWPPWFDRLPDRSPPSWWPIPVPSQDVAARMVLVVVVLTALAAVAGMARGIRVAVSIGARRLGRPT